MFTYMLHSFCIYVRQFLHICKNWEREREFLHVCQTVFTHMLKLGEGKRVFTYMLDSFYIYVRQFLHICKTVVTYM